MSRRVAVHHAEVGRAGRSGRFGRWGLGLAGVLVSAVAAITGASAGRAVAIAGGADLLGPPGSGCFGTSITALPNGNFVVTDPCWKSNIGAVYLYDGATRTVISALTGSTSGDRVGSGGVLLLASGNYVVESPSWDNAGAVDAGAITWGDRSSGVTGAVNAGNSLVGSSAQDGVGQLGVTALPNGNYVVLSPSWDENGTPDVGAATWGDGAVGTSGAIGVATSLVGSRAADRVGSSMAVLTNGNYVVKSASWTNGAATRAGAVTWGSGTTGVRGRVSEANSLVGSTIDDFVGLFNVAALSNGNYVVGSASWHNGAVVDAGAATWGDGATGTVGRVSPANSLVGTSTFDGVGGWIVPLTNGNYVVDSARWNNGATTFVGAVTWGNGNGGTTGAVSPANSLVGTKGSDEVGDNGVTALSNGNYVVGSAKWDLGLLADAGAATWGSGAGGLVGPISSVNSLVGSGTSDEVGLAITALSSGNYVVDSPFVDEIGITDVGAATWGSGTTGVIGFVSATNSLMGSQTGDIVGGFGVTALSNGNYVVASPNWSNGAAAMAGAATWGDGQSGISGRVSPANSLVGTSANDLVSFTAVIALTNGNYVVQSDDWNNGAIEQVSAVTWGNGTGGTVGAVSAANSLVGTSKGDGASEVVHPLSNGNYVVGRRGWDNGAVGDAGAVTWGSGVAGITGPVSPTNSIVGSTVNDVVGGAIVTGAGGRYAVLAPFWDSGAVVNAGAATPSRGDGPLAGVVSSENSVVGSVPTPGAGLDVAFELVRDEVIVGLPGQNAITIVAPPVVEPPVPQPTFVSLVPARLLETRVGEAVGTVDGRSQGGGRIGAGSVLALPVTGRGGVAADADSVVLNVAVTGPSGAGFVTVFPCGSPRPTASSVNYVAGGTISNAVTAKVGVDGAVCVFSLASADVVIDVVGYFPVDSGFVAMNPARVLDTRAGEAVGTVDGRFLGSGRVAAGSVLALDIAGRAGVPADAGAAVLNVAVTQPEAAGFVTVFPCGSPRPTASSLNFGVGETIADMVVAKLGVDGQVCVFSLVSTDVVIDVDGYHAAGSSFVSSSPQRVLETRAGEAVGTVDGRFQGGGAVPAGSVVELQIGGRAGVPATASSVVLNVAVTQSEAAGFVTVFPCGAPRPTASSLNFAAGETIANNVTAKLGVDGKVCVFTPTTTHLVIDLDGQYP